EAVGRLPENREVPTDGREPWLRGDIRFHETIADVAGNAKLVEALAGLQVTFPASLTWAAAREVPRLLARSLQEHEAVIEAIGRGESQKARRAMTAHVLRAGERVVEWFERRAQQPGS